MTRRVPLALAWLFLLLAAVFFLSFTMDRTLRRGEPDGGGQDALYRLIGSAKEAVGDTLFLKVDSYFHGGVDLDFNEADGPLGGHGAALESHPAPDDWIARVNSQIKSFEHRHLQGDDLKEILPFLSMAVSLDPHNVEAVLATAYWLDTYFKRTDDAVEILKKGRLANPGNWRISNALGTIYFKKKQDFRTAETFFREALEEAKGGDIEDYQRIDIYYYLGECCFRMSEKEDALRFYRAAVLRFGAGQAKPLKQSILKRIEELS